MNNGIRTSFCSIETVSCVTGFSTSRIHDLIELGHYLWVWNVSSGIGARRELRFWTREIFDRASTARLSYNAVLHSILPQRTKVTGQYDGLRSWEFRHLLRISKSSLCELRKELGIRGTTRHLFIPRANLERFFSRRWVGNFGSDKFAASKNGGSK
jgi:hypothetical protein